MSSMQLNKVNAYIAQLLLAIGSVLSMAMAIVLVMCVVVALEMAMFFTIPLLVLLMWLMWIIIKEDYFLMGYITSFIIFLFLISYIS